MAQIFLRGSSSWKIGDLEGGSGARLQRTFNQRAAHGGRQHIVHDRSATAEVVSITKEKMEQDIALYGRKRLTKFDAFICGKYDSAFDLKTGKLKTDPLTYEGDMRSMVNLSKEFGHRPIMVGMIAIAAEEVVVQDRDGVPSEAYTGYTRDYYNKINYAIAYDYGVPFLDPYALCGRESAWDLGFIHADRIHPATPAHEQISGLLLDEIDRQLAADSAALAA